MMVSRDTRVLAPISRLSLRTSHDGADGALQLPWQRQPDGASLLSPFPARGAGRRPRTLDLENSPVRGEPMATSTFWYNWIGLPKETGSISTRSRKRKDTRRKSITGQAKTSCRVVSPSLKRSPKEPNQAPGHSLVRRSSPFKKGSGKQAGTPNNGRTAKKTRKKVDTAPALAKSITMRAWGASNASPGTSRKQESPSNSKLKQTRGEVENDKVVASKSSPSQTLQDGSGVAGKSRLNKTVEGAHGVAGKSRLEQTPEGDNGVASSAEQSSKSGCGKENRGSKGLATANPGLTKQSEEKDPEAAAADPELYDFISVIEACLAEENWASETLSARIQHSAVEEVRASDKVLRKSRESPGARPKAGGKFPLVFSPPLTSTTSTLTPTGSKTKAIVLPSFPSKDPVPKTAEAQRPLQLGERVVWKTDVLGLHRGRVLTMGRSLVEIELVCIALQLIISFTGPRYYLRETIC